MSSWTGPENACCLNEPSDTFPDPELVLCEFSEPVDAILAVDVDLLTKVARAFGTSRLAPGLRITLTGKVRDHIPCVPLHGCCSMPGARAVIMPISLATVGDLDTVDGLPPLKAPTRAREGPQGDVHTREALEGTEKGKARRASENR